MPTYKNNTSADVSLEGNRAHANGGIITTKKIYSATTISNKGLTKTADVPYFNPIIVSATHTGNSLDTADQAIPTVDNDGAILDNFLIHVYCRAGAVAVYLQVVTNTPPKLLKVGEGWEFRIRDRMIDNIHLIYSATSSEVQIDVELF